MPASNNLEKLFSDLLHTAEFASLDTALAGPLVDRSVLNKMMAKLRDLRAANDIAGLVFLAKATLEKLDVAARSDSTVTLYKARILRILGTVQPGAERLSALSAAQGSVDEFRRLPETTLLACNLEYIDALLFLANLSNGDGDLSAAVASAGEAADIAKQFYESDRDVYGVQRVIGLRYKFAHRARLKPVDLEMVVEEILQICRDVSALESTKRAAFIENTLTYLSTGLPPGRLRERCVSTQQDVKAIANRSALRYGPLAKLVRNFSIQIKQFIVRAGLKC